MATETAPVPLGEKLALTYREVCQYVNLSRTTVAKLISMHEFPKPKCVGGRRLFSTAEVRFWFEGQPTEPTNGQ
jgi:excisionase family DNA binding protein